MAGGAEKQERPTAMNLVGKEIVYG